MGDENVSVADNFFGDGRFIGGEILNFDLSDILSSC